MADYLTACRACGCTTFFVHESTVWLGDIDADSAALFAHRPSCEIEAVACENCGEEYDASEFNGISFG